jgi:hypothetical protein
MDPHISVITAVLNSIIYPVYQRDVTTVVPEVDFVPFNLSYLRDFSRQSEQATNPFEGRGQNASEALPA